MRAGFIARVDTGSQRNSVDRRAIREQNSLVFVGALGDGRGVARLLGRGLLIGAGEFFIALSALQEDFDPLRAAVFGLGED